MRTTGAPDWATIATIATADSTKFIESASLKMSAVSDENVLLWSRELLEVPDLKKRSNEANEENGKENFSFSFPIPPFSPLLRF
jgi:hypothetical protein